MAHDERDLRILTSQFGQLKRLCAHRGSSRAVNRFAVLPTGFDQWVHDGVRKAKPLPLRMHKQPAQSLGKRVFQQRYRTAPPPWVNRRQTEEPARVPTHQSDHLRIAGFVIHGDAGVRRRHDGTIDAVPIHRRHQRPLIGLGVRTHQSHRGIDNPHM